MKFQKQMFGFMDMLRFRQLVPNRRKALAAGSLRPLPTHYRVNDLAKALHPGRMQVEVTALRPLSDCMTELTFRRVDGDAFPFFRAGQYVSLQGTMGTSVVSRPYSISSSPREALENKLTLGVENAGFFSAYLNREVKVGDRFVMTEPAGEFHYETLRDKPRILCVAGGSGITPFLSMAKSRKEGDEPYEMILFYGGRDVDHLAYKAELDALAAAGALQVVYVLSDETRQGYEHGFITAALMARYADLREATFFLCGPAALYDFIQKELAPLDLPRKAVRRDAGCCGARAVENPRTFTLTVHIRDKVWTIPAREDETLLTALERAGIPAPNKCRAGGCGYCHSKWLGGDFAVAEGRDGRRLADSKFGFVHPCVTYPQADMAIDVPPAE